MPASFPGAVKTFTTKNDGAGNVIFAAHINDLQDEVHAIEDGYLNGTAPINASTATFVGINATGSTITAMVANSISVSNSTTINLSVTNSTITDLTAFNIRVTNLSIQNFGTVQNSTLSTGNNNNFVVASSVGYLLLTGNSSGSTLTGLATFGGMNRPLFISNIGTSVIVLAHGSGNSASSNQFLLPGAANMNLDSQDGVLVIYDTANNKIRTMMS